MPDETVLRVGGLVKHFPVRAGLLHRRVGAVRAVDDISFTVAAGETVGLVGESGCGKSTTARCVLRLLEPTAGLIEFEGRDITHSSRSELRETRRRMGIVFQDPFASLNPRMTVSDLVTEPLHIHGRGDEATPERVGHLLDLVGLGGEHAERLPHELSGGQRQRVGVARALALEPRLLILDEPVSALDVSIQAQILNLLKRLQARLGLAYLFIAHDLAVVRHISHRVCVMYLGRIVETGDRDAVFGSPSHPYTQALLSAVPVADPSRDGTDRIVLDGDVGDPTDPPSGCRFRTRCWKADRRCAAEVPELVDRGGHPSACHYAEPGVAATRTS